MPGKKVSSENSSNGSSGLKGSDGSNGSNLNWDFPNSMNECLYFTNRETPELGRILAWVRRRECPKCHKGLMGKPIDSKTGRPKVRSTEYVCPKCGNTEEKLAHEEGCVVQIEYTCTCGHSGKTTSEYKRKSWNGVPSYVFSCDGCGKKIGITKKMKAIKGKKPSPMELDDDDDE